MEHLKMITKYYKWTSQSELQNVTNGSIISITNGASQSELPTESNK